MKIENRSIGIESCVQKFDLSSVNNDSPDDTLPITFWIPVEYKAKYDEIQRQSKRTFGKFLKQVLKDSIDKVEISA